VLVVEDEEAISRPLAAALQREGFAPRIAGSAAEALTATREWHPDAVVLDLVLPDGDGRDVCRELRAESEVPIVIVSARSDVVDRVVGLELGADDYVVKPFSSKELAARLRSVLRRAGRAETSAGAIRIGEVSVDPATRTVSVRGREEQLPARQFDVLLMLMREAGRVVRREALLDELWGGAWFRSDRTLGVHVARIRERIEPDPSAPRYITTVRGVGFRFATEDDLRATERAAQPASGSGSSPRGSSAAT
jgi:two-component system response regulator RegX3